MSEPVDIKTAIRRLQDAAWNCGTDEYREGVSDNAVNRRNEAMVKAREACVTAADVLLVRAAHDETGLNLLRQLVGGENSLRTLEVFPCNQAEHEDVDCKCFWEQCEAWAKSDPEVRP